MLDAVDSGGILGGHCCKAMARPILFRCFSALASHSCGTSGHLRVGPLAGSRTVNPRNSRRGAPPDRDQGDVTPISALSADTAPILGPGFLQVSQGLPGLTNNRPGCTKASCMAEIQAAFVILLAPR